MNLLEIIEFRDRLRADLAVVDKFIDIAKSRAESAAVMQAAMSVDNPSPTPGPSKSYGAVTESVREAIKLAPEKFNISHVYKILHGNGKPLKKLQIATVLLRLASRRYREILIEKRGIGSRATLYKRQPEKFDRETACENSSDLVLPAQITTRT